jgi:hypothetical protein
MLHPGLSSGCHDNAMKSRPRMANLNKKMSTSNDNKELIKTF